MKKQHVVLYVNEKRNLFYVGLYNEGKKFEQSSSISSHYARARFAYNTAKFENKATRALNSGFFIALLNTNEDEWAKTIINEDPLNYDEAKDLRLNTIDLISEDYDFVGAIQNYSKSHQREGVSSQTWNYRFNVSGMTKSKIMDKVNFIQTSFKKSIPQKIVNDCYMAIVCPDQYGPKAKNYGSYEVVNLGTLFLFIEDAMRN